MDFRDEWALEKQDCALVWFNVGWKELGETTHKLSAYQ